MKLNWKSILIIVVAIIVVSSVFFIITTTMSSPTVMELKMPKDEPGIYDHQKSDATLSVVILKNNMLYGYFGNDVNEGSNLEIKEVRKIILEGIQKFTRDSLTVLIKPSKDATYENTVVILDEMAINKISRYKMVDLNKQEETLLVKM